MKVRLRPWREADAGALMTHANSPGLDMGVSCASARGWLLGAAIDPSKMAIEVDGTAAGHVGFTPEGEIGFWLGSQWWGRGIATEAVRQASTWALATFDWPRISARVEPDNQASMRVLEKAGYTRNADATWSLSR